MCYSRVATVKPQKKDFKQKAQSKTEKQKNRDKKRLEAYIERKKTLRELPYSNLNESAFQEAKSSRKIAVLKTELHNIKRKYRESQKTIEEINEQRQESCIRLHAQYQELEFKAINHIQNLKDKNKELEKSVTDKDIIIKQMMAKIQNLYENIDLKQDIIDDQNLYCTCRSKLDYSNKPNNSIPSTNMDSNLQQNQQEYWNNVSALVNKQNSKQERKDDTNKEQSAYKKKKKKRKTWGHVLLDEQGEAYDNRKSDLDTNNSTVIKS